MTQDVLAEALVNLIRHHKYELGWCDNDRWGHCHIVDEARAALASPAPDPGAGPLRQATLDLDTLLYVRESIEGIQHVGGTVEPLGLIDSIIAIRAEVRGESETDR